MPEPRKCPMCDGGELVCSEGRLDQSGDTYVPTTLWSCPSCEYASWAPAVGVHWRSALAAVATPVAVPLRRRAA